MNRPRLYLIDATAYCYRAFYALGSLSASWGQPTNAIYGFISILNKILKENSPEFMAACFDVSRDTFRQKKFAEYKIQRPPMPDGLSSQIPIIKQIISAYGIAIFEKPGYEADDVIATLSHKAKQKGLPVTIVSSDKDILQLVDDNTIVFSPYKDQGVIYDAHRVRERFGVPPGAITDIIALMGDDVDNIPGLPGIGEKTAAELIRQFGSLARLSSNLDKVKKEKIRKAIADNMQRLKLNKELAVLDSNINMDFDLDRLKISKPDLKELFRLFKSLEFKKFLKDLKLDQGQPDAPSVERAEDREIRNFINPAEELILYGQRLDNLVFCAQDKIFRLDKAGPNLKEILANPDIKKTGHDLKKLKIALAEDNVDLAGLYFDTMIAAYLISSSRSGYSLADLAWDYLGKMLPLESMDNQTAVDLIARLKPLLKKELKIKELITLFADIEMPLVEVLAEMEQNGIKLDLAALKQLSTDIEERLIKLIQGIYNISGTQFNINSPKQLREILFEKLKLPVIKKSKTGPSTDEEVLRKLSARHKLPALLLEYRQLSKLKSTYIDSLPQLISRKTGRVHASFNQTGTQTGRLSSSNPNLQNIPIRGEDGKQIRKAIIASSASTCLISFDYSQIELRILAHLSRDSRLIEAFKNNQDIHTGTAGLIYGLQQQEITEQMRETAKRINFGIIYGLSNFGLSRDLGVSLEEATNFIDAYFLRYPKVRDYIEQQIDKARKEGYVTTISGRRRYIPEINHKNSSIRQFAERQAINTPIQGSASDLIKSAMIQIHSQIKRNALNAKLIMQIHDELVFDVPEAETDRLIRLARDRMENVLKLQVPIKAVIKKGRNWLEMEEVK